MEGLNLVVLRTADLESCRRFYTCFGMTFVREQHGLGPVHYSASGAQGVFEIYPAGEGGPDRTGLGFAVTDLDAIASRLRAADFEPGEPTATATGTSFVVRDPDGRRIEARASGEGRQRVARDTRR
ncbi:MAG: VOC family protein [Sporichthyaceae bacterium]